MHDLEVSSIRFCSLIQFPWASWWTWIITADSWRAGETSPKIWLVTDDGQEHVLWQTLDLVGAAALLFLDEIGLNGHTELPVHSTRYMVVSLATCL